MNSNSAIYYAFNSKNSAGENRLVQVVRIYYADLTALYMISLINGAENEFYPSEVVSKIVNSIILAEEAQNLTAESSSYEK